MTALCPACGGATFERKRYQCPPGPLTAKRRIFDVLQFAGWRTLPLEYLPHPWARRFAQGLFKFRSVLRCESCGLGLMDPMCSEQDLARFYASFYIGKYVGALPPIDARGRSQAHYLVGHIDLAAVRDVFEFGAGSAALSRALRKRAPHLRLTVAEIGHDMLNALRREPGIDRAVDVYRGETADFDLIAASHALEHVVDAAATLRKWEQLLRPGGFLFVEVPHASGDHYMDLHEYIPHTWFFTPSSLNFLACRGGLETVALETGGPTYAQAIAGLPAPIPQDWHLSGAAGAQLRGLWRKPHAHAAAT